MSRHGILVDFDKICAFYGKWSVCSDKCVSIIVKIKCVNFGNISDSCDKLNFTISYTHFTTTNTNFIKTYTNIIIFDIFYGTVRCET